MAIERTVTRTDLLRRKEYLRGFALLLAVAVVGLFWAKWQPSFARTLTILDTHAYPDPSILSGTAAAPPLASWDAAVAYARSYFLAIWQALVVGLLLAATIETFVPRDWIARVLSGSGGRPALLGGAFSLPAMMCTCCSAPVVVGLRKSGAGAGAAVAFFLGSPTLNPAVLVFLLLALGWQWAALRAVFGVALVAGGAFVAVRLAGREAILPQPPLAVSLPADGGIPPIRWLRSLGRLVVSLVPEYVVLVLALGAARAFLFPTTAVHVGNELGVMALMAVAGTIFVIPTAAEIPIILALQSVGFGSGVAGVLLLTLAPLSLPSLTMLARSFPVRVLAALAALTALAGLLCGLAVLALHL